MVTARVERYAERCVVTEAGYAVADPSEALPSWAGCERPVANCPEQAISKLQTSQGDPVSKGHIATTDYIESPPAPGSRHARDGTSSQTSAAPNGAALDKFRALVARQDDDGIRATVETLEESAASCR